VVDPPRDITSSILLGIESLKFLRYWISCICGVQSLMMASFSMGMLVGGSSAIRLFIQYQTFSIGFRSGEFPGQTIFVMDGWALNQAVTTLELWHGALILEEVGTAGPPHHGGSRSSTYLCPVIISPFLLPFPLLQHLPGTCPTP